MDDRSPGGDRAGARLAFQPTLKGRALRLLSRREHTRHELERKLGPYETEPGTLAQALDDLERKGYLSERRAAESLVHRRAALYGVTRLRQEMQDKGLARDLIDETLATLKETELARARDVWRRRFADLPQTSQERARHTRFLMSRGFAADVVRRVLGGALDDELA